VARGAAWKALLHQEGGGGELIHRSLGTGWRRRRRDQNLRELNGV
jgi:hypothetical protein